MMKLFNLIFIFLFTTQVMALPIQDFWKLQSFALIKQNKKTIHSIQGEQTSDSDESSNADPKNPITICENCINKNSKPGDFIEAGGQVWRLSYYWQEKGTWIGEYLGIASPNAKVPVMGTSVNSKERNNPDVDIEGGQVKYKGKSVDQTFGRNPDTVANGVAVRWMNAHISNLDESIHNGRIHSSDVDDVRGMVYSAVGNEAEGVLQSLDVTLQDSLKQSHRGQCDEIKCSSNDSGFGGDLQYIINANDTDESFTRSPIDEILQPENETNFEKYIGFSSYAILTNQANYKSDLKPELDKVHQQLDFNMPSSVLTEISRQKAYEYLKKSDQAALSGQRENATAFLNIAKFLADIISDISVFTSVPKDLFKAVSGVDPLTGEDLSSFDRILSVGFAVAALGTAGLSNTAKIGIKELIAAIRSEKKAVKLSVEGLDNLNKAMKAEASIAHEVASAVKSETGISVKEIVTGQAGKPYTIVGQQMDRVNTVATALRKEGKKVSVFQQSKEANELWVNEVKSKGRLNKEQANATLLFKENSAWLKSDLAKENNVIALEEITHQSYAFDMEKEIIYDHLVNKMSEVKK